MAIVAALAGMLAAPASATADLALIGKEHGSTGYSLVANDESFEANDVTVNYDAEFDQWEITDTAGIGLLGAECSRASPTVAVCPAASFQILKVETGRGADSVRAQGTYANAGVANRFIPLAVALGKGRDEFRGGRGSNLAVGGPGKDNLEGGPGFDHLVGGPGSDRLEGNGGKDVLRGRGGRDKLIGDAGVPDLLLGGGGRDFCKGDPRDRVGGCERIKVKRSG